MKLCSIFAALVLELVTTSKHQYTVALRMYVRTCISVYLYFYLSVYLLCVCFVNPTDRYVPKANYATNHQWTN